MTTQSTGPEAPRDTPVRDEPPNPREQMADAAIAMRGWRDREYRYIPEHRALAILNDALAEAQRLTVERLAWAYHQTRLRYPGGSLFCGDEHGNPYDLDDATCSCRLDMMDVAEAYVRGPALAHPEEKQRP